MRCVLKWFRCGRRSSDQHLAAARGFEVESPRAGTFGFATRVTPRRGRSRSRRTRMAPIVRRSSGRSVIMSVAIARARLRLGERRGAEAGQQRPTGAMATLAHGRMLLDALLKHDRDAGDPVEEPRCPLARPASPAPRPTDGWTACNPRSRGRARGEGGDHRGSFDTEPPGEGVQVRSEVPPSTSLALTLEVPEVDEHTDSLKGADRSFRACPPSPPRSTTDPRTQTGSPKAPWRSSNERRPDRVARALGLCSDRECARLPVPVNRRAVVGRVTLTVAMVEMPTASGRTSAAQTNVTCRHGDRVGKVRPRRDP